MAQGFVNHISGIALGLLFACCAQCEEASKIVQISIDEAKLSRIDTDSAEFELKVTGVAHKSVTLKSIVLQQIAVNGVPLHISAIPGPIKLHEGEQIKSIPVLTALVAFREAPSLAPLREMLSDGVAHIRGVALVQLELNPFEMLALHSTKAWATIKIDEDAPVELPGGVLGRTAAFAALTAAEPVWALGYEGREWRRRRSAFAAHADEALKDSVIPLECRYEIRSLAGQTRLLRNQALGFLLPSGNILTTAEAIEPWIYDSAIAEALSGHEVTVAEESVEIVARMNGADFSTRGRQVEIVRQRANNKNMLSERGKTTYQLRLRASDDNAVVLDLKDSSVRESARLKKKNELPGAEWQPAAVLRMDLDGQAAPRVWVTEVRTEYGRCVLKDPAGVAAVGSPVWIEGGVTCLLQDDTSGSFVPNILKSFPSELF